MTLRACTVVEQNVNTLAGAQVDATLFTSAVPVVIRSGREAPHYVLTGTQTSSLAQVVLDLVNAAAGDRFCVKKYTTAVLGTGAAQIQVLSGSAAGAVVGAFQVGTAAPNDVTAVFDGVQWR